MLEDFVKRTNARVDFDSRWLYWEEIANEWVVLDRPHYAKKNRTVYHGTNLDNALQALEQPIAEA